MSEPITIGIKTMKLSDNREEHFVFVNRGGREITPHRYSGPFLNRAEYEVAEWKHVLLGWPKPDLMDPKYADPIEIGKMTPQEIQKQEALVSEMAALEEQFKKELVSGEA
ncbi:hypothetical protein NKJ04_17390 [Mesorhizobium sp. M0618]|uniref:hypothetical protein n=1 Tax=Mesorhizobium sp. M0618 TaxID=2956972 RepID=UPI00333AEFD7